MTNLPDGWRWKTVCESMYCRGMTTVTTLSMSCLRSCEVDTSSECWTEMTTVWTRTGTHAPFSIRYSHVTCKHACIIDAYYHRDVTSQQSLGQPHFRNGGPAAALADASQPFGVNLSLLLFSSVFPTPLLYPLFPSIPLSPFINFLVLPFPSPLQSGPYNPARVIGNAANSGHTTFYSAPQSWLCKRCICYGKSVVLSSVHLSVCPSVTLRYCVKTWERRRMQSSPLGSSVSLDFWRQERLIGDKPLQVKFECKEVDPCENSRAVGYTFRLVAPEP